MAKEEVSEFIYSKQIPLKIEWKGGIIYNILIRNESFVINNCTHICENHKFPYIIDRKSNSNDLKISFSSTKGNIFESEKETIEECISDFLFWFELNKHRCKEITFYEKNN